MALALLALMANGGGSGAEAPTNHGAERVPGAGPPPNKVRTRCPDVIPAKDGGRHARLAEVDRLVQEAFDAASRTQENATDGPHGARNVTHWKTCTCKHWRLTSRRMTTTTRRIC